MAIGGMGSIASSRHRAFTNLESSRVRPRPRRVFPGEGLTARRLGNISEYHRLLDVPIGIGSDGFPKFDRIIDPQTEIYIPEKIPDYEYNPIEYQKFPENPTVSKITGKTPTSIRPYIKESPYHAVAWQRLQSPFIYVEDMQDVDTEHLIREYFPRLCDIIFTLLRETPHMRDLAIQLQSKFESLSTQTLPTKSLAARGEMKSMPANKRNNVRPRKPRGKGENPDAKEQAAVEGLVQRKTTTTVDQEPTASASEEKRPVATEEQMRRTVAIQNGLRKLHAEVSQSTPTSEGSSNERAIRIGNLKEELDDLHAEVTAAIQHASAQKKEKAAPTKELKDEEVLPEGTRSLAEGVLELGKADTEEDIV